MAIPKIVVAGGSGYVGRPLIRALWDNGRREVYALSRAQREIAYSHVVRWDAREAGPWEECLEGADALINLCGAGLPDGDWTAPKLSRLYEERVPPTRALAAALARRRCPPRVFISASAALYYGDRGEEPVDEAASSGADELSMLCLEWEKAALTAPPGVRTVLLRSGLVLGSGGGALQPMLARFRLFLGGPLGSGKQYVSWVSREDMIGLILHLLESDVSGPVNATAPEPVSNERLSLELAALLHRPCALRLSEGAVKLAFGALADALLAGRRVLPRRAELSGYAFKHPTLRQALTAALEG